MNEDDLDEDTDTVVITECKTGGAPGCVCAWCALMGPTPAPVAEPLEQPRPRSNTGPQPSAAYLERIADAALEARQRR